MRKLMLLALGGAAAAYLIKSRRSEEPVAPSTTSYAPGPEAGAEAPPVEEIKPGPDETRAEEAATDTNEDTAETVIPDTSADDPVVREQEDAAAAQAGSIGGPADTATADVDPEMRPVVEGSGDAAETFERTEDQGR